MSNTRLIITGIAGVFLCCGIYNTSIADAVFICHPEGLKANTYAAGTGSGTWKFVLGDNSYAKDGKEYPYYCPGGNGPAYQFTWTALSRPFNASDIGKGFGDGPCTKQTAFMLVAAACTASAKEQLRKDNNKLYLDNLNSEYYFDPNDANFAELVAKKTGFCGVTVPRVAYSQKCTNYTMQFCDAWKRKYTRNVTLPGCVAELAN